MAKVTIHQLIDDLDGESEAAETVRFSVDGTHYEIDLTGAHAAEMRAALALYVGAGVRLGRVAGSGGQVQPRGQATIDLDAKRRHLRDVRGWFATLPEGVRTHLHPKGAGVLSDRGRIPESIVQAHQDPGVLAAVTKVVEANAPVPAKAAEPVTEAVKAAPARVAKPAPPKPAKAAAAGPRDLNPVRRTTKPAAAKPSAVVDIKSATSARKPAKQSGKAAPKAEFRVAQGQ